MEIGMKEVQVRVTRKVVRNFVENDILPDSNGISHQPRRNGRAGNAETTIKSDAEIRGECLIFLCVCVSTFEWLASILI